MAAANPAKALLRELTCSVCLDYFKDPVSLDCGHNFCQDCITQCWEGLSTNFRCPECRETFSQRNFKANRHLRNMVEATRALPVESTKEPEVVRVCEKHRKDVELFCQVDQTPICMVCHLSRDHKAHTVVPIEEADEDYKEQIKSRLAILKKEREEILSFKSSEEKKSQELLKQLETESQKIVSEFQQLFQFLKEQERLLLAQLEELTKEIEKKRDEYVAQVSEEIASFSDLISEMEQKCQQPAREFLQDIKRTLSRCERKNFLNPVVFSSELKWRIGEYSENSEVLETIVKKFKDTLSSRQRLEKATVTLDPDTTHPQLVLAEDRRSVRWGGTRQPQGSVPLRFDTVYLVLGCERFASGRHYWEVEVAGNGNWYVGVAKESVLKKGQIHFIPKQGVWGVKRRAAQCLAGTSLQPGTRQAPHRIRVYLDYQRGWVELLDAGNGNPITTFPPASFNGEKLCPIFGFEFGEHFALQASLFRRGSLEGQSLLDFWFQSSQLTLCP